MVFHKLQAFAMNEDLWVRVLGKGSKVEKDANLNK